MNVSPPSVDISHCTVGVGLPEALALNVALWLSATVTLDGFFVILGTSVFAAADRVAMPTGWTAGPTDRLVKTRPGGWAGSVDAWAGLEDNSTAPATSRLAPTTTAATANRTILDMGIPSLRAGRCGRQNPLQSGYLRYVQFGKGGSGPGCTVRAVGPGRPAGVPPQPYAYPLGVNDILVV
ncbi:MAG: hypothetical protein ABSF84_03485 [Acidimicrobiales bacterium]